MMDDLHPHFERDMATLKEGVSPVIENSRRLVAGLRAHPAGVAVEAIFFSPQGRSIFWYY